MITNMIKVAETDTCLPVPEIKGKLEEYHWTGPCAISTGISCRTRKRFVKLMMAEGFSRNLANQMARSLKKGASFQNAYEYMQWEKWCFVLPIYIPEGEKYDG